MADEETITQVPHSPPACQWSMDAVIKGLSREPIGRDLALKVAKALTKGSLHHSHRDYCGHGLWLTKNGSYSLGAVLDGNEFREVLSFDTEPAFVDWLGMQSDFSLAGADKSEPQLYTASSYELNNQRLSRQRLESFVNEKLG